MADDDAGYIHFATTMNNPTTLIVVEVMKAISTASDKEKLHTLNPESMTLRITQSSQPQTSLKILSVYSNLKSCRSRVSCCFLTKLFESNLERIDLKRLAVLV